MFLKKQYNVGFRFKQLYPNKQPFVSLGLVGKPHLGIDILAAIGTPLFAPFDCIVNYEWGSQGGHQAFIKRVGKPELFRLLHLKVPPQTGQIKKGQQFGITGNSGSATNTPHLHLDISKNGILELGDINNFYDPEKYNFEDMITHKILILLSHVIEIDILKQAVLDISQRVASLGNIALEITYAETTKQFNTERNGNVVYVKAQEIAEVGHEQEVLFGKHFDLVTLIYDPSLVIGEPPTNPVENPVIVEGFNINQVPTTWFGQFVDPAKLYFYHEMLHSWYFIINTEAGIWLTDKVHNYPGGGTLEDNLKYFDSLALELKEYWPYLANTEGKIMSNAVFVHKTGTPEYGVYLPKTSVEAIKDIALNLGLDILKPDGTVDFSKAKEVSGL